MQKSESKNTFLAFIGRSGGGLLISLVLIIGVVFLLLPREAGSSAYSEEERAGALCSSLGGVGECSVALCMRDGEVVSAAILCEGADSPTVEASVKELISSLYGIGYNKISVLKLSD